MARKVWAALAANEAVCHEEVENGVAAGVFDWQTWVDDIPPYTFPNYKERGTCYRRHHFEAMVEHDGPLLSGSGIGANEHMTKAQFETYGVKVQSYTPVTNFTAVFDESTCGGALFVDLSWVNGSPNGTKTIEYTPDGGTNWFVATSTLTNTATTFRCPIFDESFHTFRIFVNGQDQPWVFAEADVLCPL